VLSVAVLAVVVVGVVWVHAHDTSVDDWTLVARCTPGEPDPGPRIVAAVSAAEPAGCRGPVDRADPGLVGTTATDPDRVELVARILVGYGQVPTVRGVTSDRSGRAVHIVAGEPLALGSHAGLGSIALGVTGLVFVSVPRDALPPTPFALIDDEGESEVSRLP
jgi:hypothetical protein